MKHYETMVVVDVTIADEAVDAEIRGIESKIAKSGSLIKSDLWGKRKLAYSINKKSHGFYAVFNYEAEAEIVAELEASFRLSETVLRWITLADQPVPSAEEEVAEEKVEEEA